MKRTTKRLLSGVLTTALLVTTLTTMQTTETPAATETPATVSRVSVHDPSIIKGEDGTYYVFGSHLADAKSSDLMAWEQMHNDYNSGNTWDWTTDSIYGDILTNLSESFAWAGYDDGDCYNGGLGLWAPDIKYNPDYVWEDSSKGAYMAYYSASSTWRRSCIGFAVSKNIEGPYEYVDTIIYSGFTRYGGTDGNSTRDTAWNNDYLHFNELIENDVIEGVSDNWFDDYGGWNANYAPNAIDPTIFYSEEGDMYMVYGSWSGGLFILEIDPATGLPIYPGVDGTDATSGNFIDRYFGTHIAGGNHQSGEGAYILYDEETDYYYLYETYGGLTAYGGYNMRLFRSQNVYGPYTDAANGNAADSGTYNDFYGIKLIGNYTFTNQTGYRAAGHNSAFIDDDGQRYLFFHQRFDTTGEYHELRVRQQFLNEDNWPVTAVYEYRGEEIDHYDSSDVVGSYEIIDHGISTDGDMISSQNIKLLEDGTVTGDLTGTWTKSTGTGKAYDYITITMNGTTYKGVLYKQFNESSDSVMTFSAIGNNNTCLWGTQLGDLSTVTIGGFRSAGTEYITHNGNFEATYTFTNKSNDSSAVWNNFIVEVADNNNYNTNICVRADNYFLHTAGGTNNHLGTWDSSYVDEATWMQNMVNGSDCVVTIRRIGTEFTFTVTAGGSTTSGTVSAPSLTDKVALRLTGEKVTLSNITYSESNSTTITTYDTDAVRADSLSGDFDTTYTFFNESTGDNVADNYIIELTNAFNTKGIIIQSNNYGYIWEENASNIEIATKETTGTFSQDDMTAGTYCSVNIVRSDNIYTITTDNGTCQTTYTVETDLGDPVVINIGGQNVTLTDVAKDGYYDLNQYHVSDFSYPNSKDMVFAGWYTDDSCTTAINESTNSGTAYAKFVDKALLTTKYQLSAGASLESESLNIRLMLGVDSLNYKKVGFKITYNNSTELDYDATVVYSAITVTTGNTTVTDLPSTYFGETAKYMLPYILRNLKQKNFDKEFQITPYWVTLDGTTVTGDERVFSINSTLNNN